jgi:hypothetical protein
MKALKYTTIKNYTLIRNQSLKKIFTDKTKTKKIDTSPTTTMKNLLPKQTTFHSQTQSTL